jgi:NADPH:quinone reductase-like Zn-dependent oxidoreductase
MKAIVLIAYGDIDKLELREMPDPHADENAIVVRVAGAGINPVDWKMRSGAAKARFPVTFPGILGRDASGTVVEVGTSVSAFRRGDPVFGLVNGAYAELVTAPASHWAKIPDGLDVAEAGALPLVLLTGAQLTEEAINPANGDVVIVTGATGSVGRVAAHAAKMRGAKVFAGVRKEHRSEAATLGVDGIVALDNDREIEKLPTLDSIADTVGGDAVKRLYGKLKPGGVIGSVLGEPAGATERGFVVHAFMAHPDAETLVRYGTEVAERRLVIPIALKRSLAEAPQAQAFAETKHPPGKVLLLV